MVVETSEWHPDVERALGLLAQRDWSGLVDVVAPLTPDSQFLLLNALSARSPLDDPLGTIPPHPIAQLIYGAVFVGWAWRHRGFGRGDEVDEQRWVPFFDRLQTATAALDEALRSDPDNGTALGFMIRARKGLNHVDELDRYEAMFWQSRTKPLDGATNLMLARCRKWHGSHREMIDVSEQIRLDQHLHPARLAIVARAAVERWLWDAHMDDDPTIRLRGQRMFARGENVVAMATLNDDYHRLMSVLPEDERDPAAEQYAANQLGAVLYLCGQYQLAKPHLELLGTAPAEWPWCYFVGAADERDWLAIRKDVGLPIQEHA